MKKQKMVYFFICLSLLMFFCILIGDIMWSRGKSFISWGDAVPQHYPAAVYWSRYLRNCFINIKDGNKISLWDFSIGFGDDILTTLNYYVGGDILSFAYAMADSALEVETVYGILVLVRFCIAGLSMYCFLSFKGKSGIACICGAIVYAFSMWSLTASTWHPFFTNAIIYVPWLLICVERIFCEGSGIRALAVVICLGAMNSLQFLFIDSIAIFIYAHFLYFSKYRFVNSTSYIKYFMKAVKAYFLGLCCASIVIVPVLIQIISSSRLSNSVFEHNMFVYDIDYYKEGFINFVRGQDFGYWTRWGYSGITLLAIIYTLNLCYKSRKRKYYSITFWIMILGMCIPFVGYFFSLGNYVSNRWSYLLSALIAVIVSEFAEDACDFKNQFMNVKGMILVSMIYLMYSAVAFFEDTWKFMVSLIVLVCFFLGIRILPIIFRKFVMLFLVCFSVCLGMILPFYQENGDYFLDKKQTYYLLSWNPFYCNDKDEEFYRSSAYTPGAYNKGMLNHSYGTSSYFSFCNGKIGELFQSLNMSTQDTHCQILSLASQTSVSALLNVKYCSVPNGYENYLPKGYCATEIKVSGANLYINNNFLPFGYTYDKQISRKQFDGMSLLDKRRVLLKAAVAEKVSKDEYVFEQKSCDIPYQIVQSEGIVWEDNIIEIVEDSAFFKLEFDEVRDSECYIYMTEVRCLDKNDAEMNMTIFFEGNIGCNVEWRQNDNPYCYGKNDILANIGYSENGQNQCTISFSGKGKIYYNTFGVQVLNMEDYQEDIASLGKDCLENVSFGINSISGDINLDESKMLCLSIPYTQGWEIYVDGKKEILQCIQVGLSGIEIDPGMHEIYLKYCTPGLKIGIIFSFIGMMIFVGICITRRELK